MANGELLEHALVYGEHKARAEPKRTCCGITSGPPSYPRGVECKEAAPHQWALMLEHGCGV